MCGIVIVVSDFGAWRDGGSVFFEGVSEDGGMFSALALALASASGGLGLSLGGREA